MEMRERAGSAEGLGLYTFVSRTDTLTVSRTDTLTVSLTQIMNAQPCPNKTLRIHKLLRVRLGDTMRIRVGDTRDSVCKSGLEISVRLFM